VCDPSFLARQRPAWHSQHDGQLGLNGTRLDRAVEPCFILELGKDRGEALLSCAVVLRAKSIDAEVTNVSDPVSVGRMD